MAIFSLKESSIINEDINLNDLPEMEPTSEALYTATMEFAQDLYKLQAGMYVSDILIEEQVMFNGADADVLYENAMGDILNKVKNTLDTIWKKIKAWFAAVFNAIKQRVLSGEKFVKEYKEEIIKKAKTYGKVYKYKGYPYLVSGELTETGQKCMDVVAKVKSDLNALADGNGAGGVLHQDVNEVLEDEIITKIDPKSLNVSDLKKYWKERLRNGDARDLTIEEAGSLQFKLDIVFSAKNEIKELKNREKAMDNVFKTSKTAFKSIENKLKSKEVAGAGSAISQALSIIKGCVTIHNAESAVLTEIYKERYSTYMRAFRGLLSYKPQTAKESFWEIGDEDDSESILETAMRMI